jgi:hypothetical protein
MKIKPKREKKKRSQREVQDTKLGFARRELEGAGYDVSEWTNADVIRVAEKLFDLDKIRGLQADLDEALAVRIEAARERRFRLRRLGCLVGFIAFVVALGVVAVSLAYR